jgi:MFS transporter, FSR family, fosmidomycin resistance protein
VDKKNLAFEWSQLLTLTAIHFMVDMVAGMFPAILPYVRSHFALSLTAGMAALTTLYFTCNILQVLTGHMRAAKTTPLFLQMGLILSVGLCVVGVVPQSIFSLWLIMGLVIISGSGIAISHPDSLRAIHNIKGIPPVVTTAVFMNGGAMGFAGGGLFSTMLVSRFGLNGLYFFLICPVVGILLVWLLKIRLAVESSEENAALSDVGGGGFTFWPLMMMAVPAAISSTLIVAFLPTRLNELEFALTFGGFSIMMFGLAGGVGTFFWAWLAHRRCEMKCTIAACLAGVPLLFGYMLLIDNKAAVYLLFAGASCCGAAYPLIVTMARYARGPKLGQRMGFIVGGAWGIASVVLLLLSPIAERFGVQTVLVFTPVGFAVSGFVGINILRTMSKREVLLNG